MKGIWNKKKRSGYYVCEIHVIGEMKEQNQQLHMLPEIPEEIEDGRLQNAALSSFPYSLYFKTVRSVITEYGEELLYRSPNEGCAILRNSIASYLLRYRGLFAQPEQIIIGSGAEHLYGTVVRILGADKIYGIEDPSYHQIRKVYEGTGAVCEMLPMGEDGIRSDVLAQTKGGCPAHVTHFHGLPVRGATSRSIGKRYEYLEWAREKHRFIVEDDFDSEFFMPGKPYGTDDIVYAM